MGKEGGVYGGRRISALREPVSSFHDGWVAAVAGVGFRTVVMTRRRKKRIVVLEMCLKGMESMFAIFLFQFCWC